MANYVSNMVVCSKAFYEKYFFDTNPFGDENVSEYIKKHPYITFNKLYGVNSLNEYEDKYWVYIYYGYGHTIKDIGNNLVEIKFQTRWDYPIYAIKKAIELEHDIVWYVCEEGTSIISKFLWNDNDVVEEEALLDDNYYDWYEENEDKCEELEDADDLLWYYDYEGQLNWKKCKKENLIIKYGKNN